MSDYDAIVIGAGHNGLTAAAVMARGGLRVLCLEKNHFIGGMSTTVDGTVTCVGSASFTVIGRQTTTVNDLLQCTQPASEAGSAAISGTTYNCAAFNAVSAIPSIGPAPP